MIKTSIAIIGLGITSKLAALSLATNNRKVMIFGSEKPKNQSSNLVTFFSLSSINFLNKLGLEDLINNSSPINEISCAKLENFRKNQSFQINFKEKDIELGRVIYNKNINEELNIKIKENKNIEVFDNVNTKNCKFSNEDNILAIDSGEKIITKLLIISDRKTNLIEENFKKYIIKKDLKQTSLVLDVKSKTANHAYQIFTKKGALAYLPVNENLASVIWSLDESSEELKYTSKNMLLEINKIFRDIVHCDEVIDFQTYKLEFEYTKKFFFESIVLIGDAAHSLHPIAGQGLNLSIKDIIELKRQITKFSYLGYALGHSSSLSEYQNFRETDNALYTFATSYFDEIFKNRNYLIDTVSNLGIKVIEKNPVIKNFIIKSATGQKY